MFSQIQERVKQMVAETVGVDYFDTAVETINNIESNKSRYIHYPFKLPIEYLPNHVKHSLSPHVCEDLELAENRGSDVNKSMYQILFQPSHPFSESMIHEWKKHYTSDVQYLRDTQDVIQEMKPITPINHKVITEIWKDTKEHPDFLEKYNYVEWEILESLNRSPGFLQILSTLNMLSPALSLIMPFLFLIFPFIILRIRGIPVSFSIYYETLKELAKYHFIGRTLTSFQSISLEKAIYLMMGAGFYFYQIYQNIVLCHRFYQNITKIYDQMSEFRDYLARTTVKMRGFVELHSYKKTYMGFCKTVSEHCRVLEKYHGELCGIRGGGCDGTSASFLSKMSGVGYLLKCYYEMHANRKYEASIRYSFGFEGFLDNLWGVADHLMRGNVALSDFSTKGTKFVKQYYPAHLGQSVKNNCDLSKKIVITGPNASGKTTFLKTTSINVIFTQQMGCGFYEGGSINPYTHIHSYLNIPDTSERDSLFQAESRRCKEIIDIIGGGMVMGTPPQYAARHYCIFDELYSGTNPVEATRSAYAFMKYLGGFSNVDLILTTHYAAVCKKLRKSKEFKNYKMEVLQDDGGKIEYTYKMKSGISKIHGAIRILEDMNYPREILDIITRSNE